MHRSGADDDGLGADRAIAIACLRNSARSLRERSFARTPLCPVRLLLGDDWSALRAARDPGFLAGDLDEDRRR
jgi:hypothetical protein